LNSWASSRTKQAIRPFARRAIGSAARMSALTISMEVSSSALPPDAQLLASGWKGCSQAASQATNEYSHPSVSDRKELPEALRKIVKHLQNSIYQKAGKGVPDYPLSIR